MNKSNSTSIISITPITLIITIMIIISIILIWVISFLLIHPGYKMVRIEEIYDKCKTGDLILFHGLDSINAIFIGCYFGHIGIVYRSSPADEPYLFEAWNPANEPFYEKQFAHGMGFSNLRHRLISYRGYVFYKELSDHPDIKHTNAFYNFIQWGMRNYHYNKKVFHNALRKFIFNDELRMGTNCGELVYTSLICLGLLDKKKFKQNNKHHLRWLCYLEKLDNGTYYKEPVYVMQEYFKR